MHATISAWSSHAMYGGRLTPHPAVAARRLFELPGVGPPGIGGGGGGGEGGGEEVPVRVPGVELRALRAAAAVSARESLAEGCNGEVAGAAAGAGKARLDAATASRVLSTAAGPAGDAADVLLDAAALNAPFLFVDTAGCFLGEIEEGGGGGGGALGRGGGGGGGRGGSKANLGEADIVVKHVLALVEGCGLPAASIGVISPYSAQTALLRALLCARFPGVRVSTVDGFQGMEEEAIVISCVRSNPKRVVGFLGDPRRMNVAVTRAKRHVCLVGDSDTLGADAFLAGLVAYAGEFGEVRTAADYEEVGEAGGLGAVAAGVAGVGFSAVAGAMERGGGGGGGGARAGPSNRSAQAAAWLTAVRKLLARFLSGCDALDFDVPAAAPAAEALRPTAGAPPPFDSGAVRVAPPPGPGIAHSVELQFPPGALSPLQRALVHVAAEALGAPHWSAGEGARRAITVAYALPSRREALRANVGATRVGAAPQEVELEEGADAGWARLALSGLDLDEEEEEEEEKREEEGEGTRKGGQPGGAAAAAAVAAAAAATAATAAAAAAAAAGGRAPPPPQTAVEGCSGGGGAAEQQPSPAPTAATKKKAPAAAAPPSAPPPSPAPAPAPPLSLNAKLNAERRAREAAAAEARLAAQRAADAEEFGSLFGCGGGGGGGGMKKKGGGAAPTAGGGGSGEPKRKPGVVPLKPLQSTLTLGGGGGGDDDMALLDALIAESKSCPAKGCSKSTASTGATCGFCHLRFCYAHAQGEVHGCGDAARAAARREWEAGAGRAALGAGAPLSQAKRDALAKQLQKKVDTASAERKAVGKKK